MNNKPHENERDLVELRRLLIGPELEKLDKLTSRLQSREQFSSDVSQILPQAMIKSAEQGQQLSQAMAPSVDELVRLSIKRDINKFADALFPVIGPAIRKSISEAFRQMLQALNHALENSFSWQGLKWRMESIRTGIPFAQIVMLHGLVYRVEQVFLIHRQTSLLLNHIGMEGSEHHNADLVSSMLSAIGDFVGDSFDMENHQPLGSIQVGDFSIWIEQGPDVILALAIRGDAPNSLRTEMQQTLEQCQQQFESELTGFTGDIKPFTSAHDLMQACMQSRYKQTNNKVSLSSWLTGIAVLILLLFWVLFSIYHGMLENEYVSRLDKEPGYVITRVFHKNDRLVIKGLRDPLSRRAGDLLSLSALQPQQVDHRFEPYQSLKTEFVHRRLMKMLNPPPNVSVKVYNGLFVVGGFASEEWIRAINTSLPLVAGLSQVDTSHLRSQIDLTSLAAPHTVELSLNVSTGHLIATGRADSNWRKQARASVSGLKGIRSYDDSRVQETLDLAVFNAPETVSLQLVKGVLRVSGQADNDWISTFKSRATNQQGIDSLNLEQLINSDEQQLDRHIQSLENLIIYFDSATSFNFAAEDAIDRAITLTWNIIDRAKKLSHQIKITVRGHSDSIGQFQDNVSLSLERADYVAQNLFLTGINPKYILLKGLEAPVKVERTIAEQKLNRRVRFEVTVE